MKIALITPQYVHKPTIGFQLRLYQIQMILERIAPGRVIIWSTRQATAINRNNPLPAEPSIDLQPDSLSRKAQSTLRDIAALALHAWPWFTVRMLGPQTEPLLAWIDREHPTHAVVDHPDGTELVPTLTQRGIKVFINCHNVDSDLTRQMIKLVGSTSEQFAWLLRWRTIKRKEKLFFPLATEVWVPSEIDVKRQYNVSSKRAQIRAVPNALDMRCYAPRPDNGSHDIVLAGDFGYAPNMVGARILRDQVLPVVRQAVPDARLILVGRDRYGLARALQHDPDVIVTGEVPDTQPYLRGAGVIAVPILQGGGTRYKILEALALALPVVSTPLGAEGLDVQDGEHLLMRDIDQFAEAIVSILLSPALGRELGRKGRQLVETKYSWEVVEKIMRMSLMPSSDGASYYHRRKRFKQDMETTSFERAIHADSSPTGTDDLTMRS